MMLSWPLLNAGLNGASALCLVAGFLLIRQSAVRVHRSFMIVAFVCSTVFFVSYLAYHARVGTVHYPGTGMRRMVYFAILISHTLLAGLVVPLVLRTLYLASRARFAEHRLWARWTLPVWLYVSVTGVVIYKMLYAAGKF